MSRDLEMRGEPGSSTTSRNGSLIRSSDESATASWSRSSCRQLLPFRRRPADQCALALPVERGCPRFSTANAMREPRQRAFCPVEALFEIRRRFASPGKVRSIVPSRDAAWTSSAGQLPAAIAGATGAEGARWCRKQVISDRRFAGNEATARAARPKVEICMIKPVGMGYCTESVPLRFFVHAGRLHARLLRRRTPVGRS